MIMKPTTDLCSGEAQKCVLQPGDVQVLPSDEAVSRRAVRCEVWNEAHMW